MTHKVHPKIYRIKGLADWEARWLTKRKNVPLYLQEDEIIRNLINERCKQGAVERVEIERFPGGNVNIIITAARPGLIIGRGGAGIEELKKRIVSALLKEGLWSQADVKKRELKIELKESENFWTSAALVAQWAAEQLEKRVPYRRVMKQAIAKVMGTKKVKGVRIQFSGRLEGVEIARREWLQEGSLPRTTLKANIDYALREAIIKQGVIGVKVWIYKNNNEK